MPYPLILNETNDQRESGGEAAKLIRSILSYRLAGYFCYSKMFIMEDVELNLDENNRGIFFITEGENQLGEMEVAVQGNNLTVYHTEVSPKAEGRGLAKKMLAAMVDYARKKN